MQLLRAGSRKRRVLAGGTVVAVLAVGAGAWVLTRSSSGNSAAATTTSTLVAVSTSTLRQTVTASGTISPATEADLSFSVSGTVTSVPVSVGSLVSKGQALATVGTADLAAAVTSAQASVTAAQDAVTAAADSTATQLASANAQLTAASAKLVTAKQDLADATLTSTIDGTVASVSIATGDEVGSSSSGGGASTAGGGSGTSASSSTGSSSSLNTTKQIVVISTGHWVVSSSVGSADLAQVKKGLQATITPSDTTQTVFGVVTSVGIVASSSTSGSASFPVAIAITGSPTGLYSGGSADVTIIVKQVQDALTVPTSAVHTVNGTTVVYQQVGGKQVNTKVTVGTVSGQNTQILTGLKTGDKVVVTGFGGPGGSTRPQGGTRSGTTGGTGQQGGFGGGGFGGGGN